MRPTVYDTLYPCIYICMYVSLQKKKRTHAGHEAEAGLPHVPKTMVMERGRVGATLNQLVKDLRQVMEPYTASKLKVSQWLPALFVGTCVSTELFF